MKMTDGPLLELRDVCKRFDAAPVLDRLSLTVRAGERRGLIGPNGAGKTTLINVITGKLRPDAGRILFRGEDITALAPHARNRRGIGRSFQILSLFAEATVGETLRAAVLRRRGLGVAAFTRLGGLADIQAECEQVAALVGLLPVLNVPVSSLAYGKQRQLDIALVLAQDPDLIILDEPAAGLSAAETRDLIDLLGVVIGNRSLILVEHDMDVVFALSDRITVLDYGRVLADGEPDAVRRDRDVQRVYLGEDTG